MSGSRQIIGGGGGSGVKAAASTGLLVSTASIAADVAWTVLPAAWRVTVAAAVGDVLTLYGLIISTQASGDLECDVASIVAGTPARYLSSGTGVQGAHGHGGLYGSSGATGFNLWQPGPVPWTVAAGDLSAGNITLSYVARASGAARTVGSAAYPSQVDVINHGAP